MKLFSFMIFDLPFVIYSITRIIKKEIL